MRFFLFIALLFGSASFLQAQLPTPELLQIYPPVVKAGSTVEIDLQGVSLEGLEKLTFTVPGIEAKPVMKPQSPFRKHQYQNGTKFSLTIPANVPVGKCEVRALGRYGISNSRILTILGPNENLIATEGSHDLATAPDLPLEAHVTGRFDANKIDLYKLTLKKGQRIIATCFSESIDGEADTTLVLKDAAGEVVKNNRDYDERESLIDFMVPNDGVWYLGAHDFTYRLGYRYHLHVTTGPHIDAVFPPSGKAGTTSEFTVFGRNLPGGSLEGGHELGGEPIESARVQIAIPAAPAKSVETDLPVNGLRKSFPYRVQNSNPWMIGVASVPTKVKSVGEGIEKLVLPSSVSGFFEKDGEPSHRFRFAATKGKNYQLNLSGDAISGRIDPYILLEKVVVAADGKESLKLVKELDDFSMGSRTAFPNLTRDPQFVFVADTDSEYQVTVQDQYRTVGFASIYILSVEEAKPDFDLIALVENNIVNGNIVRPSAVALRKGGSYLVKIEAKRTGAFNDTIKLTAKGLPAGVVMGPVSIPPGKTSTYAVFTAAANAAAWSGKVQIEAKATLGGKEVIKPVRSASPVNAVTDFNKQRLRTRMETEMALSVISSEAAPATISMKDPNPLTVEIGQPLKIPFNFSADKEVKGNVVVTPIGFPTMKKPPALNITADKKEGTVTINFTSSNDFKPTAGEYSFVLRGLGTLGKFQHFPERMNQLKEDQALVLEKIKALKPEEAKLKKQAEAEKVKIAAELKAATALSKEKDVKFGIYSAPIQLTVTAAPEKKK